VFLYYFRPDACLSAQICPIKLGKRRKLRTSYVPFSSSAGCSGTTHTRCFPTKKKARLYNCPSYSVAMGIGVLHRRLHWLILATCAFSFFSLTPFGRLYQASLGIHTSPEAKCLPAAEEDRKPQETFHSAAFLKGPPTARFQGNVRVLPCRAFD